VTARWSVAPTEEFDREFKKLDRAVQRRVLAYLHDVEGLDGIRVNQQWRICFRWTAAGPEDVDIIDYH